MGKQGGRQARPGDDETQRETLRRCPLFFGVRDEDFDAVVAYLETRVRRVEKDVVISRHGQRVVESFYILDGTVRLEIFDAWGHRALLGLKQDGFLTNAVAVFRDMPTFFTVVADTPCTVVVFSRKRAQDLISGEEAPAGLERASRAFCYNLAALTADNLGKTLRRENYLAQRSVRERITLFLSSRSELDGSRRFTLGLTRQQLADYLSMDRSTLCEELSKMQREGLIRYHLNEFELLRVK